MECANPFLEVSPALLPGTIPKGDDADTMGDSNAYSGDGNVHAVPLEGPWLKLRELGIERLSAAEAAIQAPEALKVSTALLNCLVALLWRLEAA